MEFVLIRHTRCAVQPDVCYGHLDVALHADAAGDIAQALALTPPVDEIFASPSQRCQLLALPLAARARCELNTLDDLRELSFGDWEGLSWPHIPREQSDWWAEDPWHRAPPGGETEQQLFERVNRAYCQIVSRDLRRVAVVAHAGPLRLLRCLILGRPLSERWDWRVPPGAVHTFAVESRQETHTQVAAGDRSTQIP
jgi:alpha-ribazole phosphatase